MKNVVEMNKLLNPEVFIIGGGNMGAAYARGLIDSKTIPISRVTIVEPDAARQHELAVLGVQVVSALSREIQANDLVILAIKPQVAETVCTALNPRVSESAILVSIMAGVAIDSLQAYFPGKRVLVRAMPNLPARLGMGVTVFYTSEVLTSASTSFLNQVLTSVGKVLEVSEEALIDAATAISGSGPAYFYYFAEGLIHAATELGFSKEAAELLVRQTFIGAASLTENEPCSIVELRRQVTSKGGTTEAALEAFANGQIHTITQHAVQVALKRAEELR